MNQTGMKIRHPYPFNTALFLAVFLLFSQCKVIPFNPAPAEQPVRILILGGGQDHNFNRWFKWTDTPTLEEANGDVVYTEIPDEVTPLLPALDVLYLATNQPLSDPSFRASIFDFVDEGNGLLLVHPALWYNWEDWPEYNRELVGGGAKSHGPYGKFEVSVTDPDHPIMDGIPDVFIVSDELYRFEVDEAGSNVQILATGLEPDTGKSYPMIWTVEHPRGRIVCITLGHDGETHEHRTFQRLLQNAMNWAAGKTSLYTINLLYELILSLSESKLLECHWTPVLSL